MIKRFLASVFALLAALFSPTGYALDDWQPLPTGTVSRIAFGSCAKQWEPQPVWNAVAAAKPNGVLLLSGNVHFSELSKLDGGSYPLYDLTSSGMTHVNPVYATAANRYRVAGPFIEHNFGLVTIDWNARSDPVIRLMTLGVDGQAGFEYEFSLGDL